MRSAGIKVPAPPRLNFSTDFFCSRRWDKRLWSANEQAADSLLLLYNPSLVTEGPQHATAGTGHRARRRHRYQPRCLHGISVHLPSRHCG